MSCSSERRGQSREGGWQREMPFSTPFFVPDPKSLRVFGSRIQGPVGEFYTGEHALQMTGIEKGKLG